MPLSNKELKRYKAVKEEKKREPEGNELLVRPKASGAGPYIRRALMLLKGDDKNPEAKTYKSIIIMGRGQAIGKVVQIAEIVKRRVKGIHQVTKLEAETITTRYTAKNPEEGLEDVDVERSVPGLYITLSLDELDTSNLGYQKPLPEDEVTEGDLMPKKENRKPKPSKNAGRGGRGGGGAALPSRGGRGGGSATRGKGGRGGSSGRGGSRGGARGRGN